MFPVVGKASATAAAPASSNGCAAVVTSMATASVQQVLKRLRVRARFFPVLKGAILPTFKGDVSAGLRHPLPPRLIIVFTVKLRQATKDAIRLIASS